MSMEFDSFTNRGEYFAAYYFAEQLPTDLAKGIFTRWTTRENDELHEGRTPRQQVRALRGTYLDEKHRSFFAEAAAADAEAEDDSFVHSYSNPGWAKQISSWHREVLTALGFDATPDPEPLTVHRAGHAYTVAAAWHGDGIVALDCGWAATVDTVLAADSPGQLLHPLTVSASETYRTGPALASWFFQTHMNEPDGTPPRFVLLLCGGVLLLADRHTWAEGRFLAVDLDTALERNNRAQTGELAIIAALFSHEMLALESGKAPELDTLLADSTLNATGVTGELREGLQRSVEIIANEVLARLDEAGVDPREIEDTRIPFARELTRETLRYLYRVLFLLYAEARPELAILPADDGSYEAGYSVARLRDLVERDEQLVGEEARTGFHLFASLDLLFDKVNNGHRPQGTEPDDDHDDDDDATRAQKAEIRSEDRGLRFEPLRSELFEPRSIRLIGANVPDPRADEDGPTLDLRLRNAALHEVLRLLTMKKGSKRGARGGFISYRNLGINQLGAVYEGLMSYIGIIADEQLCEVAKKGDPEKGSWLIPAHRQTDYLDSLVEYDERDRLKGLRGPKRYEKGSFVYRLAGRDRETSASYYTPESLTKVTVELTLEHRLDQQRDDKGAVIRTRAAELLSWTICEPALGSGAFLNEAINQVADEYLRRRQDELGVSISAADALTEKQRVKAYIALHNAYGVDLNATGVELAEVSLWLNTMHPGMQAPWFGLHLRRGNSLIGGRRAVYAGAHVKAKEKAWLKAKGGLAPTPLPFPETLPAGSVHQFLLPSPGWAAVSGSPEAKKLAAEPVAKLANWKKGLLRLPPAAQTVRLQSAARRVEFLWSLVAKRMEISEAAIARRIPVWGADGEEFDFLRRPTTAVPKEQVFADLFHAVDTPYWRLKKVMDAWCALWFWPVGSTDLLDGTHPDYAVSEPDPLRAWSGSAAAEQLQVVNQSVLFTVGGEQISLDDVATVEAKPTRAKPSKTRSAKTLPSRRRVIPLVNLDDWLDFLESMLGTYDVDPDSLISQFETLDELKDYEDQLPGWMGMDLGDPEVRFPWLHTVREIAEEQGFLHWELEFARVFTDTGGFDLQVGNPPWVRPEWKEDPVLAEFEPWFMLTKEPDAEEKTSRRAKELTRPNVLEYLTREITSTVTTAIFVASSQVYPLIAGSRPDLYRAFMCQTWTHRSPGGSVGLLHPDTHFSGDKEARLRQAAYRRLRVHADFVNAGNRFFPPPIGRSSHFGVHIYGSEGQVEFKHLSWLFSVDSLRLSGRLEEAADEEPPGIRHGGDWDERPHWKRILTVTSEVLARWQLLSGEERSEIEHARLLTPVSTAEDPAIEALLVYPTRMSEFTLQTTDGFNETNAKKAINGPDKNMRLIAYNRGRRGVDDYRADQWRAVILKGPQLGVANPLFKQPSQGDGEMRGLNLSTLKANALPESEYYQVADDATFLAEQEKWIDYVDLERRLAVASGADSGGTIDAVATSCDPAGKFSVKRRENAQMGIPDKPYSRFYRMAWRQMIAPDTERSLYVAIIPPGATHIHGIRSAALKTSRATALAAGMWASIPIDYLLRTTGASHLDAARAKRMPAPRGNHPLASSLLLRCLRLNCLTTAYADLWEELYVPAWQESERWAVNWQELSSLHDVIPSWSYSTPLRSERARRSALVEIDALVAVWLGISADTLIAMYRARFPIMQDFDEVTWFDANERKIAGDRYTYGHGQTKEHWAEFEAYLSTPAKLSPPEGYTAPFYKADRELEMREAHAVFQARLDAAVERGEWDPVKQEVPQR